MSERVFVNLIIQKTTICLSRHSHITGKAHHAENKNRNSLSPRRADHLSDAIRRAAKRSGARKCNKSTRAEDDTLTSRKSFLHV